MSKRLQIMDAFFAAQKSPDLIGLELGPYDRPYFPRKDYPNIKYADVFTTEELIRHASVNPNRDPSKVEAVDYVIADNLLSDVATANTFDFVYCSHVLEHVPDLIKTLQDIETILKPNGCLICAYPDRHYTFDIDRDATNFLTLTDRHARGIRKPDPETVYDYFVNYRNVMVGRLWQKLDGAKGPHVYDKATAVAKSKEAETGYVDVHCNIFDWNEFNTVIGNLRKKSLISLDIEKFSKTNAPLNEFFVVLRKS